MMKPGDILAVRGTSWFSKQILRLTGNTVSHVGMLISISPPVVIEALSRVESRDLSVSIAVCQRAYMIQDKRLTDVQREQLVEGALKFSADNYNWGDIVLQVGDAVTKTRWFTEHFAVALNRDPICSYLAGSVYRQVVGETFGVPNAKSITPADIYKYAVAHPETFDVSQIK